MPRGERRKSPPAGEGRFDVDLGGLRRAAGVASLGYLALPVGLFLAGWLRPAWAVATTAALLVGVVALGRRLVGAPPRDGDRRVVSAGALAACALAVEAAVALTGSGGFGLQTWDWAKHQAVLKDLIEQPWPVAYATGRDDVGLIYYVAYYLPAALVGKVAGWRLANVALSTWTAVGAVLALVWLIVLSRAGPWRCLAIFLLFSGLDVVGAAASTRWSGGSWLNDFDLEWWAGHWVLPANVTLMAYAPHQATGGWLLTGLLADGLRRYPARFSHVLVAALGLLWSPLATVGLLGVAGLAWIAGLGRERTPTAAVRDPADLAGGIVGLVATLYFLSRYREVALPSLYYPPVQRLTAGALALVPGRVPWREFVPAYLVFVLLEFLLLAAVLAGLHRKRRHDLRLLSAATVVLLGLPFLTYGYYNDLVMRASIPALFVLQALAAGAGDGAPRRPRWRAALLAVLVLGAANPANMLRLAAGTVIGRRALVRMTPPDAVADLFELQEQVRARYFFLAQYIGSLDTPFFRVLARRPVAVPIGRHAARGG